MHIVWFMTMFLWVLLLTWIALLSAGSQTKTNAKRFAGPVNSEDADALVIYCFAFVDYLV